MCVRVNLSFCLGAFWVLFWCFLLILYNTFVNISSLRKTVLVTFELKQGSFLSILPVLNSPLHWNIYAPSNKTELLGTHVCKGTLTFYFKYVYVPKCFTWDVGIFTQDLCGSCATLRCLTKTNKQSNKGINWTVINTLQCVYQCGIKLHLGKQRAYEGKVWLFHSASQTSRNACGSRGFHGPSVAPRAGLSLTGKRKLPEIISLSIWKVGHPWVSW